MDKCFECGGRMVQVAEGQPSECASCCQLCGEATIQGSTVEYFDPQLKVSLPGHAQCIWEAGYKRV